MNIFGILNNLYTNSSSKWIQEIDDDEQLSSFLINEWLSLNDSIRIQTRFLDKYTFHLDFKMWLSLAWSIIPKTQKAPFVKWISKVDSDEEWGFILNKIRKHLMLSDNDYKSLKLYILKYVKSDMYSWFSAYGIEKKYWKKYNLDFNRIKEYEIVKKQKGLDMFMGG